MTGETPAAYEDSLTFDRSNMELQTDDQKVFATTTTKDQTLSTLLLSSSSSSSFHPPSTPRDSTLEVVTSQTCTMPGQHTEELSAQQEVPRVDDMPPLVSSTNYLDSGGGEMDVSKASATAVVTDERLTAKGQHEGDATASGSTDQLALAGGLLLSRGLDFTGDFPMIDDEDIEEVDGDTVTLKAIPDDDVHSLSKPSSLLENSCQTTDHVNSVVVVQEGNGDSSKADVVSAAQSKDNVSDSDVADSRNTVESSHTPSFQPTLLKSALKTSRSKSKKGLRVSFHDTRVFYIDTEAEATAEPQLLTVRSLDLPLASTDYRVVSLTYDVLPRVSRDGMANGDGEIVSLQCYEVSDELTSGVEKKNEEEWETADDLQKTKTNDGVTLVLPKVVDDAVTCTDVTEAVPSGGQPNEEMVEAVVTAERIEKAVETPNLAVLEPIPSLTEANVRQHEILMERDVQALDSSDDPRDVSPTVLTKTEILETDLDAVVEVSAGNPTPIPATSQQPVHSAVCKGGSGGKTLSPPLKELTVDVNSISNGTAVDSEWQVELSPLNSIPDSETDSSHSSQDTIIMMTSEESRRNDEHIRLSTLAHQRLGSKNGSDTASIGGSSQDSDETLKYEDQNDVECRPTWTKAIDWENKVEMDQGPHQSFEGGLSSQRSNSAIRQLMERNAARRSRLRYSGTKKRSPDEVPVEKQRQWRSHESLLDTIKQLTIDGDDNPEERTDWRRQTDFRGVSVDGETPKYWNNCNGFYSSAHVENRLPNGTAARSSDGSVTVREQSGANLSLQDIRDLGGSSAQPRSQSIANVNVPGDVRQWKIESQVWNDHHGGGHIQNGTQFSSLPHALNGSVHRHPSSNDTLVKRQNLPHTQSLDRNLDHDHSVPEDDNDLGVDELAQFVQQDQDRIERIRKRYSYTDGSDYEPINAFARRPSVRGIKPRFGSTTEILKQMQNQLQPNPLINPPNGRNTMSWPYPSPTEMTNGSASSTGPPPVLVPASQRNQQQNISPNSQEDIYGTASSSSCKRSSYSSLGDVTKPPYVRLRRGREGTYVQLHGAAPLGQPPPYQPPPPPPAHLQGPTTTSGHPQYRHYHQPHQQQHQHQHHSHQSPNHYQATGVQQYLSQMPPQPHASPSRMHAKDERGAPEGASSSPKVAFDSLYHSLRHPSAVPNANGRSLSTSDNSGVVYYVMQV